MYCYLCLSARRRWDAHSMQNLAEASSAAGEVVAYIEFILTSFQQFLRLNGLESVFGSTQKVHTSELLCDRGDFYPYHYSTYNCYKPASLNRLPPRCKGWISKPPLLAIQQPNVFICISIQRMFALGTFSMGMFSAKSDTSYGNVL
uniref:Uncharacterized protein n=1 Tax=Pyricularia oryzae (strain P131) TaxID=1143193 RepID=L7IT75_PYRO1